MGSNSIINDIGKGRCIVNVSVGGAWYPHGQRRLLDSIKQHDPYSSLNLVTKQHSEFRSPYADKVMAIYQAHLLGFTKILYLDCSIWAIRSLEDIWNYIDKNGYYLYESGGNCAETCNDYSLKMYEVTRDQAEKFHEAATNVVGIDTSTAEGIQFIECVAASVSNGAIYGCKWCTPEQRLAESADPRFKYHRQDQSVISLVAGKLGWKLEKEGHFVSRWENADYTMNKNIIFKLRGGMPK